MTYFAEVRDLAYKLYGKEGLVKFMLVQNKKIGGVSPMTAILHGKGEEVVKYLQEELRKIGS